MRADRILRCAIAAASLSLAPVLSPCAAAPPSRAVVAKPAAAIDRKALLALAERLVAAAPGLAKIWPGYWPPQQAFIIYVPGQGALLISDGEKPSTFEALTGPGISARLEGRVSWHDGALPDVQRPFVTGYPIGPGKTAILVDAMELSDDKIATLLLHEQFHAYQRDAFKRYGFAQFVDPLAIKDRPAFAASAEAERRILAQALESPKPEDRLRLLRQYFALRRDRESTMTAESISVERGLELVEGTANYVDLAGLAVLNGRVGDLGPMIGARLRKPLASDAAFVAQWFRSRSYATGAAITHLISLLDPGDWRSKLEQEAMPDQLLESLVGKMPPGAVSAAARQARDSIGYATIRNELEPAIRAGEKAELKSVDEFLAGAPFRVILEAEKAGEGNAGFSANQMVQLGRATIALPKATMFNYSAPSVTLNARNRPVLMEERERYTVVVPSAPQIAGMDPKALGEHRLPSIAVLGAEIELRVDRPVVVTISETSMTVRLVDR